MIRISIAAPQEAVAVDRPLMRQVVRTVLEGEAIVKGEISLAFVDAETSRTLNNRYLQHDEPTDVLSFPLEESRGSIGGELVICAEVAKAQAQDRGHDVQAELALYTIHGLLHLCGYNDHAPAEAAGMRLRERHYLRELQLPDIAPVDE
jgi:probable rRNA maturation factor